MVYAEHHQLTLCEENSGLCMRTTGYQYVPWNLL